MYLHLQLHTIRATLTISGIASQDPMMNSDEGTRKDKLKEEKFEHFFFIIFFPL